MKCSNCGNENNVRDSFCSKCGNKLSQVEQKVKKSDNKKIPTLSWIALSLLCMQLFCFICFFNSFLYKYIYSNLLFIFEFPYTIVSLILAIISRIKNKDKMSIALIIANLLIIIIVIAFIATTAIALGTAMKSCSGSNISQQNDINNLFNEFINGVKGSTGIK